MNTRFNNPSSTSDLNAGNLDSRESIPVMIRGLAGDLATLFSKEISLAKAELREAAGKTMAAIASMAGGAVLAMAGVVVLLFSAVLGLGKVVELWLAALIVGVLALVVGFVMIKAASKKVEPSAFVPERTIQSVHNDKRTVERAMQ